MPWVVVADVPAGAGGALRYNTAYARGWSAYLGGSQLTHVRLDGTVNGWLIPARVDRAHLVVIEAASAAEVSCELIVITVLCLLAFSFARIELTFWPQAVRRSVRLPSSAKRREL
jgi:hypothetical protein